MDIVSRIRTMAETHAFDDNIVRKDTAFQYSYNVWQHLVLAKEFSLAKEVKLIIEQAYSDCLAWYSESFSMPKRFTCTVVNGCVIPLDGPAK